MYPVSQWSCLMSPPEVLTSSSASFSRMSSSLMVVVVVEVKGSGVAYLRLLELIWGLGTGPKVADTIASWCVRCQVSGVRGQV